MWVFVNDGNTGKSPACPAAPLSHHFLLPECGDIERGICSKCPNRVKMSTWKPSDGAQIFKKCIVGKVAEEMYDATFFCLSEKCKHKAWHCLALLKGRIEVFWGLAGPKNLHFILICVSTREFACVDSLMSDKV